MPKPNRLTAAERSLRGRLAVETSWANTTDPSGRTANARAGFDARFIRQVVQAARERGEPDLSPEELSRRVEHARRAYFSKLAFESAKARRRGKAAG